MYITYSKFLLNTKITFVLFLATYKKVTKIDTSFLAPF